MKKIIVIALSLVALTATPVIAQTAVQESHKTVSKKDKTKAKKYGVKKRHVRKYHLKNRELREIKKARHWAKGSKPRSVRWCESNGRYGINTGNGYYGAYQFNAGTWRSIGGGRYSNYAHKAPKFAQDHMAYKLYKQRGWQPWACA